MTANRVKFNLLATAVSIVISAVQCFGGNVAYDSFGPDDTITEQGSYQGFYIAFERKLAQRFTAQASGLLHQIEMAVTYSDSLDNQGNEITLAIVPDIDGKPGTGELWSQTYIDQVGFFYEAKGATSFSASGGPLLQMGTKYWLTSSTPTDAGLHTWWHVTTPHEPIAIYWLQGGGAHIENEWNVLDAPGDPGFGLRVTVIPEPAAATLMLAASATLLAVRRRG